MCACPLLPPQVERLVECSRSFCNHLYSTPHYPTPNPTSNKPRPVRAKPTPTPAVSFNQTQQNPSRTQRQSPPQRTQYNPQPPLKAEPRKPSHPAGTGPTRYNITPTRYPRYRWRPTKKTRCPWSCCENERGEYYEQRNERVSWPTTNTHSQATYPTLFPSALTTQEMKPRIPTWGFLMRTRPKQSVRREVSVRLRSERM